MEHTMHRRVLASGLLAVVVAACSARGSSLAPPVSASSPNGELAVALDAALVERVDAALASAVRDQRVVGAVVLVARDGKLVYHRAVGLADRERGVAMREDGIFRLASMTKPIVAVTALALVDRGVIHLDDPVTTYLPELTPRLADGRAPAITVRQLLTHTSGLGYGFLEPGDGPYHRAGVSDGLDAPGRTWADNQRRIASAPLVAPPGMRFHYSLSLDVLGEAIAHATNTPLPELVARTVTTPLGMSDTAFRVTDRARLVAPYANQPSGAPIAMTDGIVVPFADGGVAFAPSRIFDPASYPSGGAGMVGTAYDYLRFLEAVRTNRLGLAPATHAAALRDQLGGADPVELGPGKGFGFLGSVVVDPGKAGAPVSPGTVTWGGAYGHTWWIDPTEKLSVVLVTNTAFEGMVGPLVGDLQHAVYGR
jgi:CubicO group peptidase (beta-lactamase class C family)